MTQPSPSIADVLAAYHGRRPDPSDPAQAVSFGTSGHRGRATAGSFNRDHLLAITQAVVAYCRREGIDGPLFLGQDSHALSAPAWETALGVLVANGVEVRIERESALTATPLVSHAILRHNRGREAGLADGLIITPSHNPPEDGGIKYNPPHGGPADTQATAWIEAEANRLLAAGTTAGSAWTAPAPRPWRGSWPARTTSTSPSATTRTPIATALWMRRG